MSSDSWLYWYWGKEGEVDLDIPKLEILFRKNHVSKILDLGCGTGRHTIYFARRNFQVSGFDWSEKAVKRARQLLKSSKTKADLKVWDMTRLPYPYDNAYFDAVVTLKVIHHTDSKTIRRMLEEVARITRRDGFLYLQSPTYEKAMGLKAEGSKFPEVEPGTFLPDSGDEKGILHHHFKLDELLSLLADFMVIDVKVREEHYCVTARKK